MSLDAIMVSLQYYASPIVFAWLIHLIIDRSYFFHFTSLSRLKLKGLFVLQFIIGIISAYYFMVIKGNNVDVLNYWNDAKIIYSVALINPMHFIEIFFWNSNPNIPEHLLFYLKNTNHCMLISDFTMVRIQSLLMLLSGGQVITHILFFNVLTFTGICALYKSIDNINTSIIWKVGLLFMIPSTMFWTNAMHKESVLLFAIGMTSYSIEKIDWKKVFFIIAILLLVYAIRWPVLILIIPLILLSVLSTFNLSNWLNKCLTIFGTILGMIVLLYFNVLEYFIIKRQAFIDYYFGSTGIIKLDYFNSSIYDLIKESLEHALFVPFIWPLDSLKIFILAVENLLLLAFIIYFSSLIKRLFSDYLVYQFIILGTLITFIIIGFVVDNEIAIVRYKSMFYPILFMALLRLRCTK